MCVDCNNAAALSLSYPLLANKLRKCAVSPDTAIGTIGQPGKTGTPYELRAITDRPEIGIFDPLHQGERQEFSYP